MQVALRPLCERWKTRMDICSIRKFRFHQQYLITTWTWVVLTCQIKQSATITFFGIHASIDALSFFISSILWSQMHSYSIKHTYRRMSRARLHSKNFERNWSLNCVKGGTGDPSLLTSSEGKRAPHQLQHITREERVYCDLCKLLEKPRQRTRFKCNKCDMSFCFQPDRNCFQMWHSSVCDHLRR